MAAPFDLVRDGKLFGRGAQDMKGGVASILGAVRRLASSPGGLVGRVIVAIVADEEYASIGADAAARDWKADAAIVTEPTDLTIGIGHKGFEWVEVETSGIAAHGSRPDDGVDAILMMGRVLAELDALERAFIAGRPHPLLGRPSLHASLIGGGRELSTYPDRCGLSVERRTVMGEEPVACCARSRRSWPAAFGGSAIPRVGAGDVGARPTSLRRAIPCRGCCASRLGRETTVGAMSF